MTKENRDYSRRSSDAPKCSVWVAKLIPVTIIKVKSVSLAVKVEQTRIRTLWRWLDGKLSTSTGGGSEFEGN